MRDAALVVAFSLFPLAAFAQADDLWNPLDGLIEPAPAELGGAYLESPVDLAEAGALEMVIPKGKFGFVSVAGLRRFSEILSGDIDDQNLVQYTDLFKPGQGVVAELSGIVYYRGASMGLYLSGAFELYPGDTFTTSAGEKIEADDWEHWRAMAGIKAFYEFPGGFFLGGYLGGGWVYYSSLRVDDTDALGNLVPNVELFDRSIEMAVEVGARAGWGFGLVAVEGGLVYRYQQGPNRGDDAAQIVEPDPMTSLAFEVGVSFRW
jgi:hypothetical protein